MYHDLAYLWPIISPPEDYQEEAVQFATLIRQYGPPGANSVLHLGCGGGHIDFTLKNYFQVTGIDLSAEMLELARRLNPEVQYIPGDMRTVQLDRQYDAVIVADSIDYMLSELDLLQTFLNAYLHLKPGGLFCTYAEETSESFQPDRCFCTAHQGEALHVTLVETYYDPVPDDNQYDMNFVYLVRQANGLTVEVDRHTAGLFPAATWQGLLERAGFKTTRHTFKEDQIPWFIGLRL